MAGRLRAVTALLASMPLSADARTSVRAEAVSLVSETRKAASRLDLRVDGLREFHEVVLLERRLRPHVQDGMLSIQFVVNHVAFLYDCRVRGPIADGV